MTTVLLTGATGFVGSRLRPVLERRGLRVRCLSRDAARAERRFPGSEWVQADLADPVAVRKAMQGCDAAYYLVHEMGSGGDYRESLERVVVASFGADVVGSSDKSNA